MSDTPYPVLDIETRRYLDLQDAPVHIRERLSITLAPRAYEPELDDLRRDWVASVAVPAFKLIRQRQETVHAFCAIGTGTGLDVLAATEILGATHLGLTDIHADVVHAARLNILSNLNAAHPVRLDTGYGDLLAPLARYPATRYDLIYENLPNVPLDDASLIAQARTSGAHFQPRSESVPDEIQRQLLSLHFLALRQAHAHLTENGSVLSMLGARIPLAVYRHMAQQAGHHAEIHTYGWKLQDEAEDVIRGHAAQQQAGYGPFHFYAPEALDNAFGQAGPAIAGEQAEAIEAQLVPHRLDPFQALAALQQGAAIGHTYVALRSRPL